MDSDYSLNPTILIELFKEQGCTLMTALQDISLIHNSYLSIVNPGKQDG